MYDTSFDQTGSNARALWILRIAALFAVILAASADAQMFGAPVLQNAWATSGFVSAINVAGGSGQSVYAAAGSWAPVSGRFQLSGGLGYQTKTGGTSGGVYGLRVALPFGGASGSFGFAAFAGIGGGGSSKTVTTAALPAADSSASSAQIPVGVGIGWRRAVGATHGLSLYATPAYVFYTGPTKTGGLFRTAIGVDAGITSALGVTAGVDFGANRPARVGGPSGTLVGLGVSYAFGRR